MQDTNLKLIVKHQHSAKWQSGGEFPLPAVPRAGEFIALVNDDDNEVPLYRVVGVVHTAPSQGLPEVFAVYAGTLSEVQNQLLSS